MGLIAKQLSFTRTERRGANVSDVKVDPGGGANLTPEHFSPAGDDSHPLPGDYVVLVETQRTGVTAAVGYLDPNNAQKSNPGGKRIYSRNTDGDQVAEVWLKNDGSVVIQNDNGSFELQTSGQILANGARITTGGDFITAAGVSLNNHPHNQDADSDGDSEAPTDPPTVTE